MPPISHSTLRNTVLVAGLIGQFLFNSNPQLAILLCGIALVAALVDGWWYLQPLGKMWWYPTLWGLMGLTMWQEPRGWFFMAWSAIEIGTGLRAQNLIRRWERQEAQERAEEQARVERLTALGFMEAAPDAEEAPEQEPAHPVAPPPPPSPVPAWRYPLAIGLGLFGAWAGAWVSRIFFHTTGWQLDLLAIATGYLVGKAITIGAGDRSNRLLRWVSAILSAGGVLYARYLILAYVLFDKRNQPVDPAGVLKVMVAYPKETLGLWLLMYLAVGIWAGWHFSRDPRPQAGA